MNKGLKNSFTKHQSFTARWNQKGRKVYERIGAQRNTLYTQLPIYGKHRPNNETGTPALGNEQADAEKKNGLGVYFLRTDMNMRDEVVIWNIYNTIREIESSFRCLKTDLDLRPIYHKNDNSTMAHLHLGILAYWMVNTLRHQFKAKGIHHSWTEIVRIGNTQKVVTTTGQNTFDKAISIRKCSEPQVKLKELLDILKAKYQPFRKRKSVVHKLTSQNLQTQSQRLLPPP